MTESSSNNEAAGSDIIPASGRNGAKGWLGKIIKATLKWGLPLALTVMLVAYMFRKVDFAEMWDILRHGVDYWWILLAMLLSVFSHIIRAVRWRIQLRSLGVEVPLMALCCSIFGCYALNLVLPRAGEFWRCTYISSKTKAPFTKIFGSMFADRLSDSVCVLILIVLALFVATPAVNAFLVKYPVGQSLIDAVSSVWFWGVLAGGALLVWCVLRFGGSLKMVIRIKSWTAEIWKGFADVASMPGRWKFVALSAAIWTCYFVQLYVAFYAFPFTRALCAEPHLAFGLIPCLVAFVLSSIGMAVPSNGGLGPWNIAVMFGLALYGVSDVDGAAFSMLQWSGSTVMLIILGIYTMAYISLSSRHKH